MKAGDLAAAQAAVADGASVRAQDDYGQEPLHLACAYGHLDIAQWLHSAGASLNATSDNDGETPLHGACATGHLDVICWLCSAGASATFKTKNAGETPAQFLQRHGPGNNETHAFNSAMNALLAAERRWALDDRLFDAVAEGDLAAAQAAVADGASVRAQDYHEGSGEEPLHYACMHGHLDVALWLHSAGASIDATNYSTRTLLHLACSEGHLGVAQWLHSAGAPIDATDNDGQTPLHEACWYGHLEIAEWLCRVGADATLEDNHGDTPAQLLQHSDRTVQLDDQQALRSTLACLVRRAQAQGPLPCAHRSPRCRRRSN